MLRLPVVILLVMSMVSALAQAPDKVKFKVGIRGGLVSANFLFAEGPNKYAVHCPDGSLKCSGDGNTDFYTFDYDGGLKQSRLGFASGVFVERTINERLAVELAVHYEQKGINLKYESYIKEINNSRETEEWRYYERDIRNDYVVVPLVAKYRVTPGSRFYVTGGVYSGFLVRSAGMAQDSVLYLYSHQGSNGGRMQKMEQAADKTWTSSFDAGIVGGGGVRWPLNDELELTLDARLNVGLLKVDRKYNNRFEKQAVPVSYGYAPYLVISESYYRGLNSQARNISLNLTAGLSKRF